MPAAGLRRDGDHRRPLAQRRPGAAARPRSSSSVDVPLREHDERRAVRLAGHVRDGQVLLDDALARVDEDERDVGPLRGLERAQLGVVLDPLPLLALAPQAGGVDEHERRPPRWSTVSIASRVVPGTSETITRSWPTSAFRSDDLPTFGRPRMATRIASSPTGARPSPGSRVDDLVEQVAGAVTVQRRQRQRVAQAEPVELERLGSRARVVELVREHAAPASSPRAGSARAPRRRA